MNLTHDTQNQFSIARASFVGDDAFAVMPQHLTVTPERQSRYNDRVPSGWDGVVLKALRKDPEARYRSAAAFIADLGRFPSLQLADFDLGSKRPLEGAHRNCLLVLFAASLAAGFVGLSAAILGITYLVSHR